MARGLPAALADQLPFITAEVSLAKANTPRHADKLRKLAAAGCHERTERKKWCDCGFSLLLPSFPAPELWADSATEAGTSSHPCHL